MEPSHPTAIIVYPIAHGPPTPRLFPQVTPPFLRHPTRTPSRWALIVSPPFATPGVHLTTTTPTPTHPPPPPKPGGCFNPPGNDVHFLNHPQISRPTLDQHDFGKNPKPAMIWGTLLGNLGGFKDFLLFTVSPFDGPPILLFPFSALFPNRRGKQPFDF